MKRITDCFAHSRTGTQTLPSLRRTAIFGACVPHSRETDPTYRITLPAPPGIDLPTIRDLILGPKVLKELALLRHLANA